MRARDRLGPGAALAAGRAPPDAARNRAPRGLGAGQRPTPRATRGSAPHQYRERANALQRDAVTQPGALRMAVDTTAAATHAECAAPRCSDGSAARLRLARSADQRLAADALGIALGVLVDPVPADPPAGALEPD